MTKCEACGNWWPSKLMAAECCDPAPDTGYADTMSIMDVPGVGLVKRDQVTVRGHQGNDAVRTGNGGWVHADGAPLSARELRAVMRHLDSIK